MNKTKQNKKKKKKKKKTRIISSSTCVCAGFESSYHFIICPRYIGIRPSYLSNILQTYSTKESLFGEKIASVDENENLFLKNCDCIIKSRRLILYHMHIFFTRDEIYNS